jgi:hypothetical protein
MRTEAFLWAVLALVALCSASSQLPSSRLARDAAAATDPVSNPQPASTLLAPGTTALDLTVDSAVATDCSWSLGTAKAYADMTPFAGGAGSTSHSTRLAGLDPSPAVLNHVYVSCASDPSFVLSLEYRSLTTANPPFPRTGNLWGWDSLWNKSAAYLARTDLLVLYGSLSDSRAAKVQAIRALNPNVLILNSINAVEAGGGLPEDYYLHDIHGKRLEVWPGSYRLNLTKSYVADYQAHTAYDLLLKDNLVCDGMFFDNVMTTQSWQTTDMYGNPFVVDANDDGKPDDLRRRLESRCLPGDPRVPPADAERDRQRPCDGHRRAGNLGAVQRPFDRLPPGRRARAPALLRRPLGRVLQLDDRGALAARNHARGLAARPDRLRLRLRALE